MQLHFNAISEPHKPGPKWQQLFHTHWAVYAEWFKSNNQTYVPDLNTSQEALLKYMPKMWPTYKRLCKLANADEAAARFLTGFQPPAYIGACSQAVLTGEEMLLVRNYDYHPYHMEGTQLLSAWNGKKVIATSDCLIGALDGMNEDGLAISLAFGGRMSVGVGFGIPFIIRYVLEFCSTVEEAVQELSLIPSHLSYNVTLVDKKGNFKTVFLAPDRKPIITDDAFATNHQKTIDWPENAAFNDTVERSDFLCAILKEEQLNATTLIEAFLKPPLYKTLFEAGLGTLYTAIYNPKEGKVALKWQEESIAQDFENFIETDKVIHFVQSGVGVLDTKNLCSNKSRTDSSIDWIYHVDQILVDAVVTDETTKK